MTGRLNLWPIDEAPPLGAVLLAGGDDGPKPDVRYQRDPVGWARDVLGIDEHTVRWSLNPGYAHHAWDGTPDPLAAIAEGLAAGQDVGVESGTGTGKTYEAAWLALWFLACFEDALVITTAPKQDQLTTQLWKEIGGHWGRFQARYPHAETVQLRVRMRPGAEDAERWSVIGYACGVDAGAESATRAQGFHARHMLIVTEETPGIDAAVMTALANTCTGDHNLRLALGNPDHQQDELHKFCMQPGTVHVRISSLDHPNVVLGREVVAGAISRKGLERIRAKHGEGTPMYDSRVRGVSPAEAVDALIKLEWCQAAVARYRDEALRAGPTAKGVDVAQSQNGDRAAIATWQGACLLEVRAFRCTDANQLGRDVHAEMLRERVLPEHVGVDPVGVGAGTVNELRDTIGPMGWGVQALYGAATPLRFAAKGAEDDWMPDANSFANLRAQMWWQLREDLRLGRVALPPDDALIRELTTPRYRVQGGKTLVEAKEEIRKRLGGASPDRADAVVYGNWVRRRAPEPVPPPIPDPDVRRDETVILSSNGGGYLDETRFWDDLPAGF
jgi:phage terminase large subunit